MSSLPSATPLFRWRHLLLVGVGGTAGTALREWLSETIISTKNFPLSVFIINILGAFLLGVLFQSLLPSRMNEAKKVNLRLLLGTGLLAGFTTYGAFASELSVLISLGNYLAAAVYALSTLFFGLISTWCGLVISARFQRRLFPHRQKRASS